MRRMPLAIGAAACLSLLILQLSGAHIHVGTEGYVGMPEISYSHDHHEHDRQHDHDHHRDHRVADAVNEHYAPMTAGPGHDHEDVQDVALVDQTLTAYKIPLVALALVLLFLVLSGARALAVPDIAFPVLSGRHTRWRPPLRAPPRPA